MMNDFENQLDEIRLVIYEQTKGMHNAETAKAANDYGKVLAAKYGIRVVKGVSGLLEKSARAL